MRRALRPLRILRDALRMKPRVALAVGLSVFAASAAWTFTRPKLYEATAAVQFLHPRRGFAETAAAWSVVDYSGRPPDINLPLHIAAGDLLARRVADRLTAEEKQTILLFQARDPDPEALLKRLKAARRVVPYRLNGMVGISYRNRSPTIATRVSWLFAQELQQWAENMLIRNLRTELDHLNQEIEKQSQRVAALENALATPTPSLSASEANASVLDLKIGRGALADLVKRQDWLVREINHVSGRHVYTLHPSPAPTADDYVSPNIPRNLTAGLATGLVMGTVAAACAARPKLTSGSTAQT